MTPPAFRRDGSVNIVVETPRGSQAKFKYDPDTESFMLSRPLPAGIVYPYEPTGASSPRPTPPTAIRSTR